MMQISKFLPEFSTALPTSISRMTTSPQQPLHIIPEEVEDLTGERISAAYEKGKTDAEHKIRLEYATQLEQLEQQFETRLVAEKELWLQAEIIELRTEIQNAFARNEAQLSQLLCQVVKPFLKKNIAAKALSEAESLLREALSDREHFKFTISGPEIMTQKLKSAFQSSKIFFEIIESVDCEVHISCDNFKISTRIAAWLSKIDEIGLNDHE